MSDERPFEQQRYQRAVAHLSRHAAQFGLRSVKLLQGLDRPDVMAQPIKMHHILLQSMPLHAPTEPSEVDRHAEKPLLQ